MKKATLSVVSFLLCIGNIYSEGIDNIQPHVEAERTKIIVSWSMSGCYTPADSIIVDQSQKTARIYRTETVPECDMISQEKDSFYVDNGTFDELNIQLCKRSWKGGSEEKPVLGKYFVCDTKLLHLSQSGLTDIQQGYSLYCDMDEDCFRLQSDTHQTPQVTISSLNGQIIEQKTIATNETVYIGYLPTGTYLLIIDETNVFKVIKR